MSSKVFLLVALAALCGVNHGLRREVGGDTEAPTLEKQEKHHKEKRHEQKKLKSKQDASNAVESAGHGENKKENKKGRVMQALRNFFAEETTTVPPMWHGLPMYCKDRTPLEFFTNWTKEQQTDFGDRLHRWNLQEEERKRLHRCRAPKQGEKVVYLMQHAWSYPKQDDGPIFPQSRFVALNARYDPLMAKAILDPAYRVEAVISSPARKAMETAVWGFADIFPNITFEINADVKGVSNLEGVSMPRSTAKGLYNMATNNTKHFKAASELLKAYRALPSDWDTDHKPHMDRWFDFMEALLHRPEKTFLVVTHYKLLQLANISKSVYGQINIRALQPDRTWRKLSPPDCWPSSVNGTL